MELEQLERLAFGSDRSPAAAGLVQGTSDYAYFAALRFLQAGQFDDAQRIIDSWDLTGGDSNLLERLRNRQVLLRWHRTPNDIAIANDVADLLDVRLDHEPSSASGSVERNDAALASVIDSNSLDVEHILTTLRSDDATFGNATQLALPRLLSIHLSVAQREIVLDRIGECRHPLLVSLVVDDLNYRGLSSFSQRHVHSMLDRNQLELLAQALPNLRTSVSWVCAVLQRLRPSRFVDISSQTQGRRDYLRQLYAEATLWPDLFNPIKFLIVGHLIAEELRHNVRHDGLFLDYCRLRHDDLSFHKLKPSDHSRQTMMLQAAAAMGLPAIANDEVIGQYLFGYVQQTGSVPSSLAELMDQDWLTREISQLRLLAGKSTDDRDVRVVGATEVAALAKRSELTLCQHNPGRYRATDNVVLELDVKNLDRIVVKAYRIDEVAYFAVHNKAVAIDLELDGISASYEYNLEYTAPPIERRRISVPLLSCATPGTYIIEFVAAGMASRTLIFKGHLRWSARASAAGTVVVAVGAEADIGKISKSRLLYAGREFVSDQDGEILLPFSSVTQTQPALLLAGDLSSVIDLPLFAESIDMAASIVIAREQLSVGHRVQAIADVRLHIAGAQASVELIEDCNWELTLRAIDGTATSKRQPLQLSETANAVLEWTMPDDIAVIEIAISGSVRRHHDGNLLALRSHKTIDIAVPRTMSHVGGAAIYDLYLQRGANGSTMYCLGRNGEPAPSRSVMVGLRHRLSTEVIEVALQTDADGSVELGDLSMVEALHVTCGSLHRSWLFGTPRFAVSSVVIVEGDSVELPVTEFGQLRDAQMHDVMQHATLVELRGGFVARHVDHSLAWQPGRIVAAPLVAGDYRVSVAGMGHVALTVVAATAVRVDDAYVLPSALLRSPSLPPQISTVEIDDGAVRIHLRNVSAATTAHIVTTQFAADVSERMAIASRSATTDMVSLLSSQVVNQRDVGDELRYVLDRKHASRRPGSLLEKPSLLIHPWSRQATVTNTLTAAPAGRFAAPAPATRAYAAKMARESKGEQESQTLCDYRFVATTSTTISNLPLRYIGDHEAWIDIEPKRLPGSSLRVMVCDPRGAVEREILLPSQPLQKRPVTLELALTPDRHVAERRKIDITKPHVPLLVRDAATAKLRTIDTIDKLHGYLLALCSDSDLREFAFVAKWHTLSFDDKLDHCHRFACHELHLFVYFKDREFFEQQLAPLLRSKRRKTFVDDYMLGLPLQRWLEPALLSTLNACERALAAQSLPSHNGLARTLADSVFFAGNDTTQSHRVSAMLLGAALDSNTQLSEIQQAAYSGAVAAMPATFDGDELAEDREVPRELMKSRAEAMPPSGGAAKKDAARRRNTAANVFVNLETTQQWAESNWWRKRPRDGADLVRVQKFWSDLAHCSDGEFAQFLHPDVGLCVDSFASAMCAIAVTALPFSSDSPLFESVQSDLSVTTQRCALLASSQLLDREFASAGPIAVVENYLHAEARCEWTDGEWRDLYVTSDFVVGVPYIAQALLSNTTSRVIRGDTLLQVPRGAVALGPNFEKTGDVWGAGPRGATLRPSFVLEPHSTITFEYLFYFPSAGNWSHFPAHATSDGEIVGAGIPRTMVVSAKSEKIDLDNWSDLSQLAPLPKVLDFLRTKPLGPSQTLSDLAWRMRQADGYQSIVAALELRCIFVEELWAYALLHADAPRLITLLRARRMQSPDRLDIGSDGGTATVLNLFDDEDIASYEHLEFAPLVGPRAHAFAGRNQIGNQGLAAQYRAFLQLVAHRVVVTADDQLAATHYLLAMDRIDDAAKSFAAITRDPTWSSEANGRERDVARALPYDYISAYLLIAQGNTAAALSVAQRWQSCRALRWRRRFDSIIELCSAVTAVRAAPEIDHDAQSASGSQPDRERRHAAIAERQAVCSLELRRNDMLLVTQHVAHVQLKFYVIDVEVLFTKRAFDQTDVSRFAFVQPTYAMDVTVTSASQTIAWPPQVRGENLVVQTSGGGVHSAQSYYDNDLHISVSRDSGRLRVVRKSDNMPRAAAYVKAYGRGPNGVAFYKDGYTDLLGWFDYVSLSTSDLNHTEQFAILVVDDECGAATLLANPPLR
jgi:hypothetical protein